MKSIDLADAVITEWAIMGKNQYIFKDNWKKALNYLMLLRTSQKQKIKQYQESCIIEG